MGVWVDAKLTFKNHCRKLVKKASYLSYVILKYFKFCSPQSKYFIYQTYLKPILDFNIIFYFPHTIQCISLIEHVQRQFTKRICPSGLSYSQRLEMLSSCTVEKYHKILVLLYMYNIIFCGLVIDGFKYDKSTSSTRGSHFKIFQPFCRTNIRKFFPLVRYIQLWNSLELKPSNLLSFAAFKRFLIENVDESHA